MPPLPPVAPLPDRPAVVETPAGATTWRRTLRAYCCLPHAVPVVTVLAATAGFALLAADRLLPGELARLLLAMLGGQVLIGAVNELVDAELDAATKPWKPIPAGLVSRRGAWTMAAVGAGAMVAFGLGFGAPAFALLLLGTGLGLAYDLWFKRTPLSWLPYLLALPLLPTWVWTAVARFEPGLLLLYPLGAPAVVAVHLAQTLPDVAADRAAGLRNPTSLLGERRAILACWTTALLTPALALAFLAAAPDLAHQPAAARLAAGLALALVLLDAALYARRPPLGLLACFPCVASGTVAVGLGWVLAVGAG